MSSPPVPSGELLVDLDVFQGPFDLLVTLILREEIDLWEVSVSRIIADYVVRLADSFEFDLEATSHFVVLVASLLELKSRLLLDLDAAGEEDGIDPATAGEELLASLVRYAQFSNAARGIAARWEEHSGRLYRQASLPTRFRCVQAGSERLPAQSLASALKPLLREPPLPDASHITDMAATLLRELRRLRSVLQLKGELSFFAVAPRDRLEKAITFFALLELHNRGEVRLQQPRAFADIRVVPVAGAAR